jgi:cation diffusion facilitator family transporter
MDSSAEKQAVAFNSLLASGALSVLKLGAALFTGSLALLTEALHSLSDFVATGVTLAAVKWSDRPADDDHHYGHGKIESLAALFETGLLVGLALFVLWEAIQRMMAGNHAVTFTWWAVAILLISIVVDYNRSRALRRTAEKTSSAALAADAIHFASDMWTSGAALFGLFAVFMGYAWADAVVAIVVAAFILRACWSLGRASINNLLDTAPEGVTERLRALTEAVPGVLNVTQLRAKPAGADLFLSLSVDIARTHAVKEIVAIKERIEKAVKADYPKADVTITANPIALDSETAFDQVMLIAQHRGMAIHHLAVQDVNGKLAVSFDVEVDGAISLVDAHTQATHLESEIRDAFGSGTEVESHIEPLPQRVLQGREVSAKQRAEIIAKVEKLARKHTSLRDLHNIRIRDTDGALYLHYHCRFAAETSVKDVHDVIDALQAEIEAKIPGIARVIAHAEPLGAKRHQL